MLKHEKLSFINTYLINFTTTQLKYHYTDIEKGNAFISFEKAKGICKWYG